MKKYFAFLLILILVGSASYGQEAVTGQSAGKIGILFAFNGLANLGAGSYQGGFGAKLCLSDYMAVRGMLQLGIASQTIPNAGPNGTDGKKSASSLGIGGAVELHLTKGRISPYIGGGLLFSTTSTEQTLNQGTIKNNLGGETVSGQNFQAGTSIMIGGIIGVEYYVTNGVSLSAEYLVGFTTLSQKDEEYPGGTAKGGSASLIGIHSDGTLTLAVYF
ncbi:MAG: hypothetical protein EHM64_09955 [Ignavibacteriae bacterium]|nr:MAG: hypothetical protein EHM64_09955 [Ignavibacteriota bacterium]